MTRLYLDMVASPFDAGHQAFLRAALSHGDELVVGLFDDDTCEWFDRRPALPLDQRADALAGCRFVDRVIAGAPLFPGAAWLSEQAINRVVHWDGLSDVASRFWYRAPVEMGIVRTIGGLQGQPDVDPHGRTHEPVTAPTMPARSPAQRLVRRWLPNVDRLTRRRLHIRRLRRLADALRGTPLDGRFWVVGGLLLGWARAGRPLDSDLEDADFAYLDEDHDRFLASVPALARAGFRPRHRFSSAAGRYVEHRFQRGRVQYDFFRITRVADRFRYSMFVRGAEPIELVAEVPAQARVPFRFLERDWLKVADHDLALRTIYGEWQADRPDWSFTMDRAIVERVPMPLLPLDWNWPSAVPFGPGERTDLTPHGPKGSR